MPVSAGMAGASYLLGNVIPSGLISWLVILGCVKVSHKLLVTLTKSFSSPRLETRTKESNMCASMRVVNSGAK